MEHYNKAEICLNGHLISANSSPINHQEFCTQCGKLTITNCQKCNEPIRGWLEVDGLTVVRRKSQYKIPAYCHSCGEPYPWTVTAINTAEMLIREDDEVSQEEMEKLIDVISDLIVETPRTKLATVRLNKYLMKATKFTVDGLRQFLIDFGCEFVLKSLDMK